MKRLGVMMAGVLVIGSSAAGAVKESWDWPKAMQQVARRFSGTEGVVLHIGDSITYANPYGQWARYGKGKSESDKQILKWMHTNENNDLDGWYLAAYDVKAGGKMLGRSYTAASGIRVDQYLKGGFKKMPPLKAIIKKYNPQIAVLMLGTNDVSAGRKVEAYKADLEQAVRLILDNGTVCVLSTIPPHCRKPDLARAYNKAIVEVAEKYKLPLIDFYGEIIDRRPKDWNGTLLGKNDVHPSARAGKVRASSAPTPENLSKVGYLLRGWLTVQKIKQVKAKVIDPLKKAASQKPKQPQSP